MNDTGTHAGWFDEVDHILAVTRITPGLPIPYINKYRASFYFTDSPHAADAAEAVGNAETILAYALDVSFADGTTQAGTILYRAREAYLPSGLLVSLVTQAEHADPRAYAAERAAAIHAEVAAMQPVSAVA